MNTYGTSVPSPAEVCIRTGYELYELLLANVFTCIEVDCVCTHVGSSKDPASP